MKFIKLDIEIFIKVLIIILFILFSGFFVLVDTAIFSIPLSRIQYLVETKHKNAEILRSMRDNPNRTVVAVLFGTLIFVVGATSIATEILTEIFGIYGEIFAIILMTFFVMTFAEVLPKTYSLGNVDLALFGAKILKYFIYFLFPLIFFIEKFSSLFLYIFGIKKKEFKITEEEIISLAKIGEKEKAISLEGRKMIENVFKFNDKTVKEIMVNKEDIEGIDINSSDEDVSKIIEKTPHSMLVVYENNLDDIKNIKGILPVEKILKKNVKNIGIVDFKKQPLINANFIPENKKIDELFNEMKKRRIKMAIVVNEKGKIAGLVTMDDLIEEITGDIP